MDVFVLNNLEIETQSLAIRHLGYALFGVFFLDRILETSYIQGGLTGGLKSAKEMAIITLNQSGS